MKNDFYELSCFLAGTFHQDMGKPDAALKDYISEVDAECLKKDIEEIEFFLKSELTEDEKEKFIKCNTDIYFPAIKMQPIEWLVSVLTELKTYSI